MDGVKLLRQRSNRAIKLSVHGHKNPDRPPISIPGAPSPPGGLSVYMPPLERARLAIMEDRPKSPGIENKDLVALGAGAPAGRSPTIKVEPGTDGHTAATATPTLDLTGSPEVQEVPVTTSVPRRISIPSGDSTSPLLEDSPDAFGANATAYSDISTVALQEESRLARQARRESSRFKGLTEADLDNLDTDFDRSSPLLVDPHLNSYSQKRAPLFNPFQSFSGISHHLDGQSLLALGIIQDTLLERSVGADPLQLPPVDTYEPHNSRHELSPMRSYRLSLGSPIFSSLRIFETPLFRPWGEYLIDNAAQPEKLRLKLKNYKTPVSRQHDNALGCFMAWLYPDNPKVRDLDNVVYAYLVRYKANAFQANRRAGSLIPAFGARMPLLRTRFLRARRFHREWYAEYSKAKDLKTNAAAPLDMSARPPARPQRKLQYSDDDSDFELPSAPKKPRRSRSSRLKKASSRGKKARFERAGSPASTATPTPPPKRRRRKRQPILDVIDDSELDEEIESPDLKRKSFADSDSDDDLVLRDERGNAI